MDRPVRRLVTPFVFFPLFVSSVAAFWWLFQWLRAYSFASEFDRMAETFPTADSSFSPIAWESFQQAYSVGLNLIVGTVGMIGLLVVLSYCAYRYRVMLSALNAMQEEKEAQGNADSDTRTLPREFWHETGFRFGIGLLLIAISLIIGHAERSRDAFDLALMDEIYPDVVWFSNIEFTVGMVGCLILSSFVFLWSRIQYIAPESEDDPQMAVESELERSVRQWEASLKQ